MDGAEAPRHLVVMGVSGVGKTSVAVSLARALGYGFVEGDDFHPPANIEKMSAGIPLDDDDRWPWLRALADWTRDQDAQGNSTVVTCSALKRRYRDVLRDRLPTTYFVHLTGDRAALMSRMKSRSHFMPPALLDSQLSTLEPLGADEPGLVVDVSRPVDGIVADLVRELA